MTTSEHGTNGPSMTHSISTRDSQSKEGPPQETPEPHVHTHTESHHHPAVTHSEDGTTSQTSAVARYTEGPYKGMTYEEADYEWRTRYDKLQQRVLEHANKAIALTEARLKSTDDELSAILSVIALLSPEQLEIARQEALKTVPADQVETFFEDLANHSTTKTPDQIAKDAEEIISFREAYKVADRQLRVESRQTDVELRELIRNKP